MTKDEALQLALDALEIYGSRAPAVQETITALREALAQPEQEPVGRFAKFSDGLWREVTEYSDGVMLYTSPPQRQPLTDFEIVEALMPVNVFGDGYHLRIARAIEAAHGIGDKT